MAEELGARLLSSVEQDTLDQVFLSAKSRYRQSVAAAFLTTLQENHHDARPYPHLSVPPLDNLLGRLLAHGPAATSPAIIQITSTTTGGGSTSLLYLATAAAVLPRPSSDSDQSRDCRGKGGVAVVIDVEGRFDVGRLECIMHSQVQGDDEKEEAVRAALRHVHVFRPQSFNQLILTLEQLPAYLEKLLDTQHPHHASAGRALELLAIDSVSVFYWQQRQEEAQRQRMLEVGQDEGVSTSAADPWNRMIQAIRQLQHRYGVAVVATAWPVISNGRVVRSQAPPAWQAMVDARLVVSRVEADSRPSDSTMTAEPGRQAQHDARQQARPKWQFAAWGVDERAVVKAPTWNFYIDDTGIGTELPKE